MLDLDRALLLITWMLLYATLCQSIGGIFRASSFRDKDYFSDAYEPYIKEEELFVDKPNYNSIENGKKSIRSDASILNERGDPSQNNIRGSAMPSAPKKSGSHWIKNFPKVKINVDPVVNFKLRQRLYQLGTCVTLGMDYLSELGRWRFHCAVEDTFVGGRFSMRGSELGWAKSWRANMGLGEDNTVKFKLRVGYNTKTGQSYARVRFRTEPISPFDIQEGITCTGRVPLPGLLPALRAVPLRVEYKFRMTTPIPSLRLTRSEKDDRISFCTGIDRINVSVDELNFCMEWDDSSPVWDIGIVRRASSSRDRLSSLLRRRNIRMRAFAQNFWTKLFR